MNGVGDLVQGCQFNDEFVSRVLLECGCSTTNHVRNLDLVGTRSKSVFDIAEGTGNCEMNAIHQKQKLEYFNSPHVPF